MGDDASVCKPLVGLGVRRLRIWTFVEEALGEHDLFAGGRPAFYAIGRVVIVGFMLDSAGLQ